MVNVVFVDVLHAKIVHDKGEADGVPIVLPVSWCDSALAVTCFVKAVDIGLVESPFQHTCL
jgi:hypothetical protein